MNGITSCSPYLNVPCPGSRVTLPHRSRPSRQVRYWAVIVLITSACQAPAAVPAAADDGPTVPDTTVLLDGLAQMSNAQLAEVDIAKVNLACAVGLPGSQRLDETAVLATLNRWADRVRSETEKYLPDYRRRPEYYGNSLGRFRIEAMITILQLDLGVRYNPTRIRNVDFTRSQDLFLHGLVGGDGGTCCSMPVLYVAIGRRLGYPLKLVEGPEHLFLRWEDPDTRERFNIEGTSRGFLSEPDEYYETWPRKMTAAERRTGYFLKSLSPREELACFLTTRAHALLDLGRQDEATATYSTALTLSPKNIPATIWLERARKDTSDRAALGATHAANSRSVNQPATPSSPRLP